MSRPGQRANRVRTSVTSAFSRSFLSFARIPEHQSDTEALAGAVRVINEFLEAHDNPAKLSIELRLPYDESGRLKAGQVGELTITLEGPKSETS
jgi:hypothetical protein